MENIFINKFEEIISFEKHVKEYTNDMDNQIEELKLAKKTELEEKIDLSEIKEEHIIFIKELQEGIDYGNQEINKIKNELIDSETNVGSIIEIFPEQKQIETENGIFSVTRGVKKIDISELSIKEYGDRIKLQLIN